MPRLLFITILLFSVAVSAQERKYQRKSISSLGLLNLSLVSVPSAMIENRINYHIQLPRFDYNSLSDSALSAYRERVSALGFRNATPSQITAILNETIIPQVSLALKAVAEERALGNLKEEDLAMAAANKLKGSGLTAEDILKVLNAAYLYVPVVTRYNESTDEERNLTVEISGYILWFRVKTNPDGNSEAVFLQGGSVMQSGTATASIDKNYQTRRRTLSGEDYARLSAIEAWARNLSLAMRRLPDFQVTAEILSLRGATPEANIGTREGVELDDGFYAEELFENSKGELEERKIGFFRVASVGDNRKNPSATSTFYPHITSGVERGVLLKEHPQFGLDIAIRPKFFRLRLSKETTPLRREMLSEYGVDDFSFTTVPLAFALKEDVTEAGGIELGFHYNLAKQTGVRQLFATADFGFGIGNTSFTPAAPNGISALILSGYAGAMKKFWLRRWNFYLGVSGGVDGLFLSVGNTGEGDLESLSFITASVRADFGLEFMLTPDLLFSIGGNYKVGFPPFLSSLKYKDSSAEDDSQTFSIPFTARGFRDTNFNGITLNIGISYSLPSFGFSLGDIESIDY
ncbi:MAG: hypothetical protein ACK412_08100 [Chloroherpetonaceae bacterium]